jgi:hypothetical protein
MSAPKPALKVESKGHMGQRWASVRLPWGGKVQAIERPDKGIEIVTPGVRTWSLSNLTALKEALGLIEEKIKEWQNKGVSDEKGPTLADEQTLRPKRMTEIYSGQDVSLYKKGNIFHLISKVKRWGPAEFKRFGTLRATFRPDKQGWYVQTLNKSDAGALSMDDERITVMELVEVIGADGEVCMIGLNCPDHQGEES